MIVELPFASELIHLTEWKQILNVLKDRDMYDAIRELVNPYCISEKSEKGIYTEKQHQIITKQIFDFADNQITAEANGAEELLLTEPIKNLCARFNHQVPVTVVQGAKGSGKTFLYRQLIEKKNWNSFFMKLLIKKISEENGYFIPVLAPQSISQLKTVLGQCIDYFNEALPFADVSQSIYSDNSYKLDLKANKEIDWMNFWEQLFVNSVNKEFTSFAQLNEKLKEEEKTVIFLIDGLEEILKAVSSNKNQQKAIEVLC